MRIGAMVHAGGKASRMGYREKALIDVGGSPMVDRVLEALEGCHRISEVLVTVSGNTLRTREHLVSRGNRVLDTSGEDYVADLQGALGEMKGDSVLVCPADLPLLTPEAIDALLDAYLSEPAESFQVAVPADLVREAGVSPSYTFVSDGDELALSAVSVVDRKGIVEDRMLGVGTYVTDDLRFALNVNTPEDLGRVRRAFRPGRAASRS